MSSSVPNKSRDTRYMFQDGIFSAGCASTIAPATSARGPVGASTSATAGCSGSSGMATSKSLLGSAGMTGGSSVAVSTGLGAATGSAGASATGMRFSRSPFFARLTTGIWNTSSSSDTSNPVQSNAATLLRGIEPVMSGSKCTRNVGIMLPTGCTGENVAIFSVANGLARKKARARSVTPGCCASRLPRSCCVRRVGVPKKTTIARASGAAGDARRRLAAIFRTPTLRDTRNTNRPRPIKKGRACYRPVNVAAGLTGRPQ